MDGKLQALIILLVYNLALWVAMFYITLLGLQMGLTGSNMEYTSTLINSYQEEYDTQELNITQLNEYVDDNKLKIFGQLLFFNISNLGIWSLFVVFIPFIASVGLAVLVIRGV